MDDLSPIERLTRDAFEEFYARTAPALRAYIRRVAENSAVVDDILQEAYIRLLNGAPAEEARRKAYLYRTAANLILDHCRAQARERGWLSALRWSWREEAPDSTWATDVERVFAMLSVRERSLLWLAYVEGASHDEIASALGCGQRSVRVLLFRARRKMASLLRRREICVGDLL